jgi:hypothetical protein
MDEKIPLPTAPVSPFVTKAASEWKPPDFAYHAPKDLFAYTSHERPHERILGKAGRNVVEER